MSGMAGNVTAFNTVWTFDIYQSYIRPRQSDAHYLWMGRMATVFGVLVSIATAYAAMRFNNIMDMLQLVFSFVNAPLFATFLLGMFWKRTTGHGAFWGLVLGTSAAALHYELTGVAGAASLMPKIAVVHVYPSDMAQNFWGAIVAWTTCFVATAAISAMTIPKADVELHGLVFGLTPQSSSGEISWHRRPAVLAGVVLTLTLALNLLFW
jgi:SSS family solute:Na+ symporter